MQELHSCLHHNKSLSSLHCIAPTLLFYYDVVLHNVSLHNIARYVFHLTLSHDYQKLTMPIASLCVCLTNDKKGGYIGGRLRKKGINAVIILQTLHSKVHMKQKKWQKS